MQTKVDNRPMSEETLLIQRCLDQLNAGDSSVRGELLQVACHRLHRLTAKMKRSFERVGRWEQTEDVLQNASLRLYQSMKDVHIADVRHFFRLAAMQIRRELIDLSRHYHGPQGIGANHASHPAGGCASDSQGQEVARFEPAAESLDEFQMQQWGDFHRCVSELPDKEREVFELLWYHEMNQEEAAELLKISTRTIKRIWRSARLILHGRLSEQTRTSF